jgi:uncharacterized protein (TIGR01777 family)
LVILHKDDLKNIVLAISVLITGASGLVGSRLTELLIENGFSVSHLGRSKKSGAVPSFVWNVEKGTIDRDSLHDVQVIVHLAGAGVAEKRWTASRKLEILESRTKSSELLFRTLQTSTHQVKAVVSASAIGYYGSTLSDQVFREDDGPGSDFLAGVVDAWEHSIEKISSLGVRVARIRIGIVFAKEGGALQEMARPVRLFVGSPLGSGKQIVSWIHIDDVCNIFVKAIEDHSMSGAYNAVAPHPASNRDITKDIAYVLHRPIIFPAVPAFVLRIILGEMVDAVVKGSNVSAEKILSAGFRFKYQNLREALVACLK